ncbi:MAG: poly-gamma-glutamate system protein [candidate division WOR-3 bacterium]|nr:MAG: poly-gamma-glutamate system protein [candidate division WOR-3 bacterium]
MKKREGKISIVSLLIVTTITVVLMVVELNSKTKVEAKYHNEKMRAAETAARAFGVIKDTVMQIGIPIDRINDPNETGMIGLQYSPITTERGDLDSKLSSTNPNFAALVVQLIKNAGIGENDTVAISLSGSLPALNINVISAIEVLNIKPIIITSVSASMWGANYPQLTYLDMENVIADRGIVKEKTVTASLGGEDDVGRGLSPAGREIIEQAADRNSVPILDARNLDDMIERKMEKFLSFGTVRLFINVGERTTALAGATTDIGLIKPHAVPTGQGLIARFSQNGIPVINLTDVNTLAREYELGVAPIPLPKPGEGRLYYEYKYSVTIAIIAALVLVIILFVVLRYDVDSYLRKEKK